MNDVFLLILKEKEKLIEDGKCAPYYLETEDSKCVFYVFNTLWISQDGLRSSQCLTL